MGVHLMRHPFATGNRTFAGPGQDAVHERKQKKQDNSALSTHESNHEKPPVKSKTPKFGQRRYLLLESEIVNGRQATMGLDI